MKLISFPSTNPFACSVFEVKEFPEYTDLAMYERHELDGFLEVVFNPHSDDLLGIEVDEEDIEYIEYHYAPGVQRL